MPQFSGCGPLASHTIPAACLSSTGFRQIRPTRPVGGKQVPSLASWSLCCQLPQTRLPHMTRGSLQSFAYFHQPITPKESHSWRIRSSVWVTVQPLSLQGGRKWAGSEITHLSQVYCVRLGHWDTCNPCGDQVPSNLEGGATPRMAQSLDRGVLPARRVGEGVGRTDCQGGRCFSISPSSRASSSCFPGGGTLWVLDATCPPQSVCLVLSQEDGEDEALLSGSVKPSVISVTFWPGLHSLEDFDLRFEQQSGVITVTLQSCRQRSGLRMSVLAGSRVPLRCCFFLFLAFF